MRMRPSASSICSWVGSSATDGLPDEYLCGEGLADGGALVDARELPLRRVRRRHGEVRRGADLLGHRQGPLGELLEPGARREHTPGPELDQLAREAEADRAPEVLLDQPPRVARQRLAV